MAKKKTAASDSSDSAPPTPRKRTTTTKRGKATAAAATPVDLSATADDVGLATSASAGLSDVAPMNAPLGQPITPEQIAEAAYQRYLRRGAEHGRDFDDWVEAERELRSQH